MLAFMSYLWIIGLNKTGTRLSSVMFVAGQINSGQGRVL